MSLVNDEPCRPGPSWRAQFGCPAGLVGWLIGHLMALKNRERSLWVLSLLDLQPADRVLEIGFGSGMDVLRVSRRSVDGFVAGVDHSETMLQQARRRNASAMAQGRVDLRRASASALPYGDGQFDKAFAINSAQFWRDATSDLRELRRVLKPGGWCAIAVQPRAKGATEETARETGRALVAAMEEAGFESCRLASLALRPVSVVCAMGVSRPAPTTGA